MSHITMLCFVYSFSYSLQYLLEMLWTCYALVNVKWIYSWRLASFLFVYLYFYVVAPLIGKSSYSLHVHKIFWTTQCNKMNVFLWRLPWTNTCMIWDNDPSFNPYQYQPPQSMGTHNLFYTEGLYIGHFNAIIDCLIICKYIFRF